MAYSYLSDSTYEGFTLIELMVTIAIISILAAIAIPSYRQFVRTNTESQVKAEMLNIATQLASWRSKSLTYAGFKPKNVDNGSTINDYSTGTTGGIYIPLGSDATTHKYLITLKDNNGNVLTSSSSDGKTWNMIAVPNSHNTTFASMDNIYIDNKGIRCTYPRAATTEKCAATVAYKW